MLKKFKDFDAKKFQSQKIYEQLVAEDNAIQQVPEDVLLPGTENPDTNVELNTSVYEDEYFKKIASIIIKRLNKSGLTNFAVYPDLVYINNTPGVWFYNADDDTQNIVVCRNQYGKVMSFFKSFSLDDENTAEVTLTSKKIGFSDMINDMIDYVTPVTSIEEGLEVIEEGAFRASTGYGLPFVEKVTSWDTELKEWIATQLASKGKTEVQNIIVGKADSDDICERIWEACDRKNGQVKYAVGLIYDALNHIYPEVEDVMKGSAVTSTKTAIAVSMGDPAAIEAAEKARAEARDKWLSEEERKYDDAIQLVADTVDTFCHYVKNNGELDDDDRSMFDSKGLYIIGSPGAGKTYTLYETMKKNGMVKDRDFVEWKNRSSNVNALYNTCYEFNGKLIIMDDSANVVSGAKSAFWKALLQTNETEVKYPLEVSDESDKYYAVKGLTRQDRYFKEIGQRSSAETEKFIKEKEREKWEPDRIEAELARMEHETKPRIPDEFVFTGCIVIIGNMTEDELKRSTSQTGGKLDWDAVRDRFGGLVNIAPPSEIIWRKIKMKLRAEQAKSETELPDALCTVPREYIDVFIDTVDEYLSGAHGPQYSKISWRLPATIGQKFRGEKGRRNWVTKLEYYMQTGDYNK